MAKTDEFKLNDRQLEAVKAPLGPVLILAGAGSGKTRALTMRIVYLINKLGFQPEEILAVTFTNKAAGEMKERIIKLLQTPRKNSKFEILNSKLPIMGTFHSVGARILREDGEWLGLSRSFVIYDDDDQENLLKDILINLRIDPTKLKPSLFASIIDRAKNHLAEPEDVEVGDRTFNKTARAVYREYEKQLRAHNAVDFGDLIMLPVLLFRRRPKILEKYQRRWKYVLVDEYQDTNPAQYEFTKLLARKHRNLFVVGDDAQAIYGFRGANLQNILDFKDDYPKAKIVKLEQNYRSTSQILSVAEQVIALNPNQHKKTLWTENHTGGKPALFAAADESEEAWFVASTIIKIQDPSLSGLGRAGNEAAAPGVLEKTESSDFVYEPDDETVPSESFREKEEGILSRVMRLSGNKILPRLKNKKGLNGIAVLYRTHVQSRALEEAFIASSIPYQIVGGLKFYERREIKDVIAYLRFLLNPSDLVSLKRIVNVPPRGIGPKSFSFLKEALLHKKEKQLGALLAAKPAIKSFFEIMDRLTQLEEKFSLLDLLKTLLELTGYEKFLQDGTEEGEGRAENVMELFNVASNYKTLPWKEGLVGFLEEIALMTSADERDDESDKVTMMTLHQAKGLEFDTVFLIGLEEGLLPHARSLLESKDVAEEIRLAYVGVTRAKKRLHLVYALSRKQFGMRNASMPSRILKTIPEELLEIYEPKY